MKLGWQFVINHHWWTWNNVTIHRALAVALSACLGELVQQKLIDNRRQHRRPGSLEEISSWEFLRRDSNHTKRVVNGGNQVTFQLLLGLSSVLDMPFADLLPDRCLLIRNMTLELSGPQLSLSDATTYAMFRVLRAADGEHGRSYEQQFSQTQLAKIAQAMESNQTPADIERSIEEVTGLLGPVLHGIDLSMEATRG